MNIDFLRKLKLVLYVVSFAVIFIFGYLAESTGSKMKMMIIVLVLLAVNFAVYKIAAAYNKKQDKKDGV
ncbi:MAG: hypothetical protein FWG57_00360 [Endomicrobia bacterium]|nr:hypothetical protein [Endomicrobiia bacterium]